ncbi:dihydrolipoamide acetyltransferase family protein [Bacillus sp. FJAT-50079]|uniref:dihydrolipoamide acetyltransferase family protein n=1 Tax=Bacillus sp. FJAT-50079 TaxID=2833577 RepID=UPI001BC9959A|nr:2-oxo acid dehydrogenase subunit E2 [Bacillus sp. FJAT-50079]
MFHVKLPQTSDEIEESLVVFWHVEEGDKVEEGDTLVEVQTEKAVFEIEAEEAGTIHQIIVKRGDSAKVGDVLVTIDTGADSETVKPTIPEDRAESAVALDDRSFVRISPRLRKLAKDLNVNLTDVIGTGPGGALTEEDIQQASAGSIEMGTKTEEMAGIRKTIATRMMKSLQESAQLTITAWADVTAIGTKRKERMSSISWNSIISHAAIRALEQHQALNAHIKDGRVTYYEQIHLGMAVDTDEGLYVPVLRDADQLTLNELDEALKNISRNLSEKNLSSVELTGSTFTITNLGGYGVQFFTPIINPPEVCILGIGKIEPYIILENGEIIQKERVPLSLTFDHRIIDGAPAARYLQTLADLCQVF